jgi:hypothetical protein
LLIRDFKNSGSGRQLRAANGTNAISNQAHTMLTRHKLGLRSEDIANMRLSAFIDRAITGGGRTLRPIEPHRVLGNGFPRNLNFSAGHTSIFKRR